MKTISDIRCHAAFNSRKIQSSLMYRSGERFVGILRSTSFQASVESTIDCMGFGLRQQYDYNRQRASNQDCKFAISNDLHPTANILQVKSRWETSSVHATVPYGLAYSSFMVRGPEKQNVAKTPVRAGVTRNVRVFQGGNSTLIITRVRHEMCLLRV